MARGHWLFSGLAWSGSGAIKRVDVTIDGWAQPGIQARIDGPSLPRRLHRSISIIHWDGFGNAAAIPRHR